MPQSRTVTAALRGLRVALPLVPLIAVPGALRAEKQVVVRSVVDGTYAEKRAASNPPPVERYVFARGHYFNPIPMDRYLERMDFQTIATTIAKDLHPRGYEPAKDLLVADLVLVVHWGVTLANNPAADSLLHDNNLLQTAAVEVAEAQAQAGDSANYGRLGLLEAKGLLDTVVDTQLAFRAAAATATATHGRHEAGRVSNAQLLGLQAAMVEEDEAVFGSALGDTLRLMVNEERYFIVVIAYDAAALREGRKKRVWTTRASIRAAGVNFAIALDRLSGSAGAHHGVPQKGLEFAVSKDRIGRVKDGIVTIGEIKVLGESAVPLPRGEK